MHRNDHSDQIFEALRQFYEEVDRLVSCLITRHATRIRCRPGCCRCCVDGMTVFEVEAEYILQRHEGLLKSGTPHPEGACAFLGEFGNCRIYEHRPYVCRTQGLPLRWLEENQDGHTVEMRDICPLNEEGPPVETLSIEACWPIGPFEKKLARFQVALGGVTHLRKPLRALFRVE